MQIRHGLKSRRSALAFRTGMGWGTSLTAVVALSLAVGVPALAQQPAEPIHPPPHYAPWPNLGTGQNERQIQGSLMLGPELQRAQSPRAMLAERRKLDAALAALQPQRRGIVDAYVVAIALDSDPVFSREAREAGRVLARRYDAAGRSLTLAGPDGRTAELPRGSLESLTLALARVGELIDPAEDVLVLFATSHGAPDGLAYHYGDTGFGVLSPYRLASVLGELRVHRRIVVLNACYSGVFVPYLATRDSAVLTAAAADRTSFGCAAENDWTFFGDALVNNALRKPAALATAAAEAQRLVAAWEGQGAIEESLPQVHIGDGAAAWLPALEGRMPKGASAPVGTPSIASLQR